MTDPSSTFEKASLMFPGVTVTQGWYVTNVFKKQEMLPLPEGTKEGWLGREMHFQKAAQEKNVLSKVEIWSV